MNWTPCLPETGTLRRGVSTSTRCRPHIVPICGPLPLLASSGTQEEGGAQRRPGHEAEQVTAARRTLDAAVTEREFLAAIISLAKLNGWATYHTHDSRRSDPGFPDLVAVRGAQMLIMEAKREKGRVTPEQQAWIDRLWQVKYVTASVVRPHDLDEIARVLTARAR
ncbi:MAG TPA: hypothetical protein DCP69_04435 [Candidatus Omnitrophica bacterium]|nr:hypothetical protein [Candidatus Omnitrophota bacterium]